MSKTLATLRDSLSQNIGDYLHETVTTALTTDNSVVSTNLAKYTTKDDWFNRQWCLITSLANAGANRKIFDYESPANTLSVQGAAFASDTAALATFEIHAYNPDNKKRAINAAAKLTFPTLYRPVEWDSTLVMGNCLPNGHFEDWAVSTYPDYYTVINATATKTTASASLHGGATSAKVAATAANGYMNLSSDDYPQLLNLAGQTISFKAWVLPEVANDAVLEINYGMTDGTSTTLTSTSTCVAANWSQISLDDQAIASNMNGIDFRFKVKTNAKYVYYDSARVIGPGVYEHILPTDFQTGEVSAVYKQISGNSDDICDDLKTNMSQVEPLYGWSTYTQGGIKYLRLPEASSDEVKLILKGYTPLENNLSADTDTMTISDPQAELLLMYAAFKLYEMEAGLADGEAKAALRTEAMYWFNQYQFNKSSIGMTTPQSQTRIRRI